MTSVRKKIETPVQEKLLEAVSIIVDWRVFYSSTGGNYRALKALYPRLHHAYGARLLSLTRARRNSTPAEIPAEPLSLGFPFNQLPEGKLKDRLWNFKLDGLKNTLYHSSYYNLPPTNSLPVVATIHDLIPEVFPEACPGEHYTKLKERKSQLARTATRFLAVSAWTKNDLCRLLHVSPDKVDVVPNAVDFEFFAAEVTAKKPSTATPFLLVVGGRDDHKNFPRLLAAYAQSSLKNDFEIVATGEAWSQKEVALMEKHGIAARLKNLGHVDDLTLRTLFHTCSALVYPSYYEGFGMPPLEAMAAGTPVSVGETGAVREVVGDAGFYFDPHDEQAMERAIDRAVRGGRNSPEVQRGLARARQFSWDRTAELAASSFRRALEEFQR